MKKLLCVMLITLLTFGLMGCGNSVEKDVEQLLSNDLKTSVNITELYYHEEEQACIVAFETPTFTDSAAIYFDDNKVLYESEFDYYSEKAEMLRDEYPINESELHECNEKVLEYGDFVMWKFTIAMSGATDENGWAQIK